MQTQLQIGDVARLLGITTKTLRHYEKIGLLEEAERTKAGYRLFSAQDLLQVQRIRRLQNLGLSLKQIKIMLQETKQTFSLREVLQTLDKNLADEVDLIQARRNQIKQLLDETTFTSMEQLPIESRGLTLVQALLGERLADISPETIEIEKQAWNLLDNFQWPGEYHVPIEQIIRQFEDRPELLNTLANLSEKMASLSTLPEDSGEIENLITEFLTQKDLIELLLILQSHIGSQPKMAQPFMDVLSELLGEIFSDTQRRFFKTISEHIVSIDSLKDAQQ